MEVCGSMYFMTGLSRGGIITGLAKNLAQFRPSTSSYNIMLVSFLKVEAIHFLPQSIE